MVLNANDDLPEPDTPVKTTNLFFGMSKSIFLRLFSRAPRIFIKPDIAKLNIGKKPRISTDVPEKSFRHVFYLDDIFIFLPLKNLDLTIYQKPEHGLRPALVPAHHQPKHLFHRHYQMSRYIHRPLGHNKYPQEPVHD